MWSSRLAFFTVAHLVVLAASKIITTSYSANGPVVFNTGGVALYLSTGETCRDQKFTLASTSVDGATVSFSFTGTGITLNCMTDYDRGVYTMTVDSQNSKTASGISSARSCTAIYSVTGLPNTQHTFLLKTAKQTLVASNDTSAKFEFMSFEVTVPDDPTQTTQAPPDSTGNDQNPPTSTEPLGGSSAASLSGGAIAGIVIAAVGGIAAVVFGFLLFKRYRTRTGPPSLPAPTPSPFIPPPQQPTPQSRYMGYPELMPGSPPPVSLYGRQGTIPYSYSPPR